MVTLVSGFTFQTWTKMAAEVIQLRCAVQSYAWGKIGSDSAVAQLSQSNPSFVLEENKPYAELWMGTHPNGPSTVCGTANQSLSDWIASHDGCLGNRVTELFGGKLPFMFKVLSVNKSLSIQAHPDRELAEKLHAARPDIYKDPNHKPEMAIALTEYEGLCGFRPVNEMKGYLKSIPELAAVIGDASDSLLNSDDDSSTRNGLKECFSALMAHPADKVSQQLNTLMTRVTSLKKTNQDTAHCLGDLLLRLNSQFPGDIGCFCIYFLNHVTLQPGEAMFLGPNLPHAYLAGDCMECMACSDNVVRAGLTPKFKDIQTLCEMLDYKPGSAEDNIFPSHPDPGDNNVLIYNPPVEDFSVARINLPCECSEYTVKPLGGPSILMVISGNGVASSTCPIKLERGTVLFIPANRDLRLTIDGKEGLVAFRAYCDPS